MNESYSREKFDKAQTEEEKNELLEEAHKEAVSEDKDFDYSTQQKEEAGYERISFIGRENINGVKIDVIWNGPIPINNDEHNLTGQYQMSLPQVQTYFSAENAKKYGFKYRPDAPSTTKINLSQDPAVAKKAFEHACDMARNGYDSNKIYGSIEFFAKRESKK